MKLCMTLTLFRIHDSRKRITGPMPGCREVVVANGVATALDDDVRALSNVLVDDVAAPKGLGGW